MSITVACPSCNAMLEAPESASGKKAKCPKCGQVMMIPEVVQDAEPVGGDEGQGAAPQGIGDLLDEAEEYPVAGGEQAEAEAAPGENRRPCPMCGEMIMAGAVKCRYCGEVFDPALRDADRVTGFARRSEREDPNATTIFVLGLLGVLCCGLLAIPAWAMGNNHRQMVRSGVYRESGIATAGWILGIIGTCWMAVAIVLGLLIAIAEH